MDRSTKKFKKSGTYHRKLKLIREKYRLMFKTLRVNRNTARNSIAVAAVRKITTFTEGREPDSVLGTFISLRKGEFRKATELIFGHDAHLIEMPLITKFQTIRPRETPHTKVKHESAQTVLYSIYPFNIIQ